MKDNMATTGNSLNGEILSGINTLQSLTPSELFWYQRLVALHPFRLPFDIPHQIAEPRWAISRWQSLSPQKSQEAPWRIVLQAFVIYLTRLSQQSAYQIGWSVALNNNRANLASVVPMDIEVAWDKPWREVADAVDDELTRLAQHQTFSRDHLSHLLSLHAIPELSTHHPWPVAVSVIQDGRLRDQQASGELLTFQINEQGGFRWIYDENRLNREVIARMDDHLQMLLLSKGRSDDIPIGQLNLLPEAERTLLLETWNATKTTYPDQSCLHQIFEQQAEKTPQATALIAGDKRLSYNALNTRANQLAHQLIKQGVCPGDHIVLLFERSIMLVVAQLAVLKAGAVYVPLDPTVPDKRKNWLINDCAAKLLLTDTQTAIPADLVVPLLRLADESNTSSEQQSVNPDLPRASTELAYIMYTSGSTGTPKGVLVPHRAVVRLVINNGYAAIEPDDRVAFTANPAFDASTFEVWAPLLNGGALVVIDHTTLLTPVELIRVLQTHRITVLWLTIGLFNRLAVELSVVLPQIKMLIFGGDIPDLSVIAQVLKHRPPQQLLQAYGPTEGTTFTTIYPVEVLEEGMIRLPIGRPIANTRIYLLDSHGQPVPLGAIGEIYVGGDGVACGYLNRPELTVQRFLIDPFSDNPDARLYRTGDLARYRPDGNLEFLGRNDQQVKIRGFRIEPGEIEARLAEYPAVREAVVLALGGGMDKRLVAYVVADMDEELVNSLRTHLSAVLPDYMVPVAFVRLDAFPLTPNGKLDRRALPIPSNEAFARQIYKTPQGETEMALAAIWGGLLGMEQISRHDNFFALGGDSLLAVHMIGHLRQRGLALTASDLFQSPVLADLAKRLGQHQSIEIPPNVITPATQQLIPAMLPLVDLTQADIDHIVEQVPGGVANIQDIYALSPLQDGILFHHLLAREGDPYLLTVQMIFADRSLLDRYLTAMQRMIERHDILRTAFIWQNISVPVQVVWRHAALSVTELTLDPADGPVIDQLNRHFDLRHYRLDLGQAPLLHFVVAQETDGRWFLLELHHHLIGDHEALEMMHREVQLYLTGQEENLPVPMPFRNLVAQSWLGENQAAHTCFFSEMLAEVEEPTLPFGLTEVHRDGSQVTESHQMLTPELNDRLRSQARQLGVSLAALCHLAWAQVLSCTSGQEKVVFGTVLFGRMAAGEGADSGMGLFINTLPLRLDMDNTPVRDSVQTTHRRLAGLLAHEHASLVLAQQCSGVDRGTPLFSALLNYRHNVLLGMSGELVSGIEFVGEQERTNYPFALSVEDYGDALGLTAQVVQPFEPARVCGYMQQALESLVEALEQAPEIPVRQLDILPETERTLLLKTWNRTETAYPEALCIHQWFEQQVAKTPQATALVYENQTLSYAELNVRANRLAHQLMALGVAPEQRVAICVSRSPTMVVALLAVLKAGGAYVPLDPAYPGERLVYILKDASPVLVLADKTGRTALGEQALAERTVLDPNNRFDRPDSNPQIPALTARHLAYVIYTSGSTGTPKGVMVEHRGVVNLALAQIARFKVNGSSRILQFASLGFDASVWEIMIALSSGASLALPADTIRQDLRRLWYYLEEQAVTHACLPPALLREGTDLPEIAIRPTLVLAGEAPNASLLQALSSRAMLFNAYGPTEITICATVWRCPSDYTDTVVSIGRPIANTCLYLLDIHGQPVPLGAVGELYIGGAGVARGYLNRPELTAERFLADPFSDSPDARMYRTGDLARYRPDGNLEFLGRNDQQVKIRGFRIEPGEIESRLAGHPMVHESVVLAQGEGQDKRLVAYVVAAADEELVNSLRAHLSAVLPDYMVPAAFVRLDAFPLSPNGKLDRRALPAPDGEAFARQIYEAPQGETENTLAAIWREILGIESISRHDNFFALGGHSLLVVRMMNRIAVLGVELPLPVLFSTPSLVALAEAVQARIDKQNHVVPAIISVSREGILPLSFAQQRLWFLTQFEGVSETYHIPMALRLRGELDIAVWQQALNALFARHEALRSVFVSVDGQPQIRLLTADHGLPWVQHDLRGDPDAEVILERLCTKEMSAPFELNCGPLIRAVLIRLADDEYQFLLTQHHIISDGWSVNVLVQELNTLYSAFLAGQPDPLPPLAIQYPDYAVWQRQWLSAERIQVQSDYWRTTLADVPVLLELPTDRPRPPEQSFAGQALPINLGAELTAALKRLSAQQGVTLFMTLLSAWAIVLSRLSGQEDVVIGTPSAGRNHQEVESLIGFFVNTLALRMGVSGELTVAELLAQVRQTALAAQTHQDLPFEQVVEIVQPPRQLAHTPLFQVMFAWQNNEYTDWTLPGLVVSPAEQAFDIVKFDLELNLSEEAGRIVGYLGYSTALFNQPTVERHIGYLHAVLQAMVTDYQQQVGKIEMLLPAERRLLLETWNATETPYPDTLCIHQGFEQQAEKTPQATALIAGDKTLSYSELNTWANQLAHQLIERGVCPGDPVGLLFERSIMLVVAQLAVLKAGAVYVPLDPSVPDERKNWLINDCAAKLLLTDTQADIPADLAVPRLCLADESNTNNEQYSVNPDLPRISTDLAYIMYTSGSTGTPKGVLVPHRAVVRLVINNGYAAIEQDDRVAFTANPAFDASTFEVWAPLLNGGALVVLDHATLLTPVELVRVLQTHRITILWLTIGLFNRLAVELSPVLPQIKTLIFGGDIPDLSVIAQVLKHRPPQQLLQAYGPTEGTTFTTIYPVEVLEEGMIRLPIGRPIANTRVYLLDKHGQPVPLGTTGEIYVGGDGVACGYLHRPELTAERFLIDPFNDTPDARMYRTGDLARYLSDGNLEFLGRNDQQVKIRGFRIEPGEIETRLAEYPAVREAVVLALGDGAEKWLVAYVVAQAEEELANSLRTHLSAVLPDYMVPAAFVRLDAFPLTPNGKLDRRALPAPDREAFVWQAYEAPQGETEMTLAAIWCELLGMQQVSRHDSFFALGGHSLLAVRMIERLRQQGLALTARELFRSPVLSELAQTVGQHQTIKIPQNVISPDTQQLTPAMLPLAELTQADIDHIIEQVPGGVANIQDIYALSPLQDGILFHHLLAHEGDPYLLSSQMAFADRAFLDRYLAAMQRVVDRHDILRTAFIWQNLSAPVQVVWRHAALSVTELTLDTAEGSVSRQLAARFNVSHYRLDLSDAPLLRFVVAQETDGRWIALQLLHHLIGDHETLEVMHREVQACLTGQEQSLAAPVPFRNLVAQARLGMSQEAHTRFFSEMLAEVEEPTLPFGLAEVHRDGTQVTQSYRLLAPELNNRLRHQARQQGVSLAALCHLAWAQVLSRTSGQEKVVFGTVLFGRMAGGEGTEGGMGLFINTLPLRLDMGDTPVRDSIQATHRRLAGLLTHEHASLALAQQCSGVEPGTPLFSALLNYRHNDQSNQLDNTLEGTELLDGQERTNYPVVLSVEDFSEALGLTVQVVQPFEPERVCSYMQQALESLVDALEQAPETPVRALDILPQAERTLLLTTWNTTETPYPAALCIHQLFEQQVVKTPQATALIAGDKVLNYSELNTQANQLAHQLIERGVCPGDPIVLLFERSIMLVVAQLAVLKAGAAYVPLDPRMPDERKNWLINDCTAKLLLTDTQTETPAGLVVPLLRLADEDKTASKQNSINPDLPCASTALAYIMYTSGSTGTPKGVLVPHRAVVRLVINNGYAVIEQDDRVAFTANPAFDASTFEVWAPLLNGGALVVIDHTTLLTSAELVRALQTHRITILWLTIGLFNRLVVELSPVLPQIKTLIFGGDIPDLPLIAQVLKHRPPQQLLQAYGPTEGTTFTTMYPIKALEEGMIRLPIGRPIANTQVYLLDSHGQPVPLGAIGEIYVGGDGVACGYLNRPELTAERFLIDPFNDTPDARMYRTGDLARYLPDGNLEFLGRNDQQVKIRGFRIEPGEIETRLTEYPAVREAAVLALGDGMDKRLVAYVVADMDEELVNSLRTHLSAVLPDYMVPVAFVRLDAFPLTPNGKLDHRALPIPDADAFARQVYEAPQGETEMMLAAIWRELLGMEQVSRHDSFFALGGHSLLAVRMIERLRQQGLALTVRDLFRSPVLSELAQTLGRYQTIEIPPNVITPATQQLTPAMLPLVDLTQADIDHIVEQVPGGVANIQDIYALSPLQDGILFHHLLAQEGDPYLLSGQMAFADRTLLDRYLAAMQRMIDRHDILRTAFIWQGVSVPVQVVWRHAALSVTELTLDLAEGPVSHQLAARFNVSHYRLGLSDAPLLRFVVAQEADGRWIVLQLLHHLIGDHETLEVMHREVQACLTGQEQSLAAPVPFRNLVAQVRLGVSQAAHTRFFSEMLAEVEEPTLPFGLAEVHRDGTQVTQSHRLLAPALNDRLRHQARQQGVSLAALCHLAWAQVLSRTSGQEKVVFGTVLFGRMTGGEGADGGMGLFINTLPLRLDMDDTPVQDSVQAAHRRLAGLLTHEHASLALAQQCSGVERGTPLFSALLNYRHNDQSNQLDKSLEGIELLDGQERTNYPLTLSVEDFGKALGLTVQIVQPFEPERICSYMQQALESLVDALEKTPEIPVRQLDILPQAERIRLLKTWNRTETAYPETLCIHQLFEQQAAKTPQATALVYENQTLSYAELNAQANRLAHQLMALGVEPEQRVAICVARSPAMVVGLLAVLKAGGAYVPLDPAYPGERLADNLRDAEPAIVLADNTGRTALGEQALAGRRVLDPNILFEQSDSNPQIAVLTSRSLAYVMYTSGSTGRPKGVMVEQGSLLNLYAVLTKRVFANSSAPYRVSLNASISFDASLQNLLSLLNGYTLVIVSQEVRVDGAALLQFLIKADLDVLDCTPMQLEMLLAAGICQHKKALVLLVGGEAISTQTWQTVIGIPQLTAYNVYGPTECTVDATLAHIGPEHPYPIIGRPLDNTRLYLLDNFGQPVPLGAVGELYIGGVGVARGYLNRPELTAERFLADPFSDTPDARMYRSGDLARYRSDGNLEFLGRNDQQVKIRGFRIEPGEIEARLAEHPAVHESVVLTQGEGQDKRLVAYVVTETVGDAGLANSLRTHLSAVLPDYMVPAAFVRLDSIPQTPNGKLDRRALPAPEEDAFARQAYEAPQGAMEITLAAIWEELLGIEQVSRHDSFFALGGHSLLAVRMIERLRQQGLTLTARDLFRLPVLSDLVQTLGRHQTIEVPPNVITAETQQLTPAMLPLADLTQADIDHIVGQVPGGVANIQDIYALSPLQDGILFHHLLAREGDTYLLSGQMVFVDRALLDRYLAAIQRVVDRHDILRTAFIWQGVSTPVQVVWRHAPLSVTELILDPADGPVSRQLDERFNINQYRLDLSDAPLLRFVVAKEADDRWIVLQLQHHLIGDHETLEVMHREVQTCLTGQEESLAAPVPFRNLVAQVRLGVSQAAHTRFFTDMLAEVTEPTLPFGLAEVHLDGSQERECYRLLTPELNDRLRRQARQHGVSLAALCHLAWAQVLSRTSGQEKVVFGTVLFGRMSAGEGADNGMGLFINTLPLRLDMDDTPVRDSIQTVHRRLAGLLAHEHASLVLAQQCSGIERGTPLFSALLNYRHNSPSAPADNTLAGIEFLDGKERTNYPFVLSVEDFGDALGLTASVVQPFEPEQIWGYMQQALESLADALEHTPDRQVRALDILPQAERTQLLTAWNATETPYPDTLCIHQLFEQQVAKTPDATALVYEEQTLSYAELNARANQLAHQLIELGIEPEQRVAVCVSRSPAMVIGLLAILKAGGAYVPLDPAYPVDRLAYMLEDAAPVAILTQTEWVDRLANTVPMVVLDAQAAFLMSHSTDNPDAQALGLTSHHLAYVIYTSGSTGLPKGVMNSHHALCNRLLWFVRDIVTVPLVGALKTNISFVDSVTEMLSVLLSGGKLVVFSDQAVKDLDRFCDGLRRFDVNYLVLVPSLLKHLIQVHGDKLKFIRTLVCSGERLAPELARQIVADYPWLRLLNFYGSSEINGDATWYEYKAQTGIPEASVIGRPIANTRIYLLDPAGQPVPLGVIGEIYIAGAGVARGYLNRPELTAECFLHDPFSGSPDVKMYRTGDLARYRPDGNLEFLGRNDQQVKIRGFRIEPGEIEARLTEYPAVREAAVLALGDGTEKWLVAYVVVEEEEELANSLRTHLSAVLPDYMVPAAFVRLDAFPLTPNGKLDRRALPAPDGDAFARQTYAAPQGKTEMTLAAIWGELLGIEQISRHDSFFVLGGHSLLAVRMIERLRQQGLTLTARELFRSPVLSELAQTLGQHQTLEIPPNMITAETQQLTPAMLPLADLTQADIDHIVKQVPGGVANIQDIYALSPLQDGILFHHLLAREGDTYLLSGQMAFADRALLDRYLAAMQQIIERHDILRTAFIWQGISVPVQVVWRHAPLSVTELTLDPADGPVLDQLSRRFDPSYYRLDLRQAPLLHFVVAQEADGRWVVLQLLHHLIGDHQTLEVVHREVQICLTGHEQSLAAPVPFRNLVAQARLGVSQAAHTRFFTDMLAEVEEPTLPFGLAAVHLDGSQERECYRLLTPELNDRLRHQARQQGVSLAALCHLAWAQVLSRTSGQEKVVFGTVLFGRMTGGEGADGGMGLFINTLPLRLDIDDTPVQGSVQAAHRRLAGLLTHEHASLVLAQQCSGVERGTPLFSALLNYRHINYPHNSLSTLSDDTLAGIEFLDGKERTNYPFGLSVEDFGDALGLTASVVPPFEPERIWGYMQQALESLVEALENTPTKPVRALDILPQAEKTLLLGIWNAAETTYPEILCIHQLFEQQVAKTPQVMALEYQGQTLNYAELNAWANRLAYQLIESGVEPEQRVAICVARSPVMVVSFLAVLKAGGAYVPLDTTYPAERLAYILSDSAPSVILADRAGQSILGDKVLAELTVLDPTVPPDQPDSNPQVSVLTPQHLAYVIYTSGSTGQPKGVMVEHQAIYQRTLGVNELYGVTAQDRVLQFAAFAFDIAVEECFSALCHGATLVIRDDSWLTSMLEFITLVREKRITVLFLPTLFWSELAGRDKGLPLPDVLRLMIIGSEAVQKKALQDWFSQAGHRPRLLNAYGPTENTVTATCQEIFSPDDDRAIGRPLSNTRIYLLDSHGQPVPLGGVGEIYIGGVGVARGYLNQLILSEERFIPDPFSPVPEARMYRTGDMACYRPDGNLEFLGRNDQQVKIRGFRIEPGEIETRLLEYPAVQEAVVLARDDGQGKRLVAYIVAETGIAEADKTLVNNLRTHLSAVLPDYMVPAAFVCLDSFPQTPNGKLDRRALPAPDGDAFVRQIYAAPQGEMEIALAAIWREVLGIEQISRHDNFIALGGHSLLVMQVMNRIAALGIELPLSELFSSPSLAALAEKLYTRFEQQNTLPPILPLSREGGLPLSFVQERLWFLTQFKGVSERYHMPLVWHLRGQLDIAAWQQALNVLFVRHEALRSVFVSVDGQPQVHLLAADRGLPLVHHDLRECPDAETALERLRIEEVSAPFDLSQGPLVRTMLIRLADDDYQFLLTQHHIISDGWSVKEVLIAELNTLYTAFLAGQPDPLPALAIQYPDYAAWQRQWFSAERMQAQADYWRTALADAPALLNLPTDRPRPSEQSFVGQVLPINLDVELIAALKRLSAQHNVTLFMTLLSAWTVVLSRLSGQEDIIVGTPSSGRSRQEVEPLIGFFVNILALRTRVSDDLTVAELLAQVRQTTLAAQAHQDLPFEQVMESVLPPRGPDHTPLCQVMFAWQDYEDPHWTLPGLTVSSVIHDLHIIHCDLEIEFFEENGMIAGAINYATALFDQSTIERHIDHFLIVLQAMVNDSQKRIGEMDILRTAKQ
ncbi:non-ribosomal peptide synthase/polyketide synthase [Xenorhabdus indica]|uniref:non-ribosomal peptide synthase/polyketide synthase n=8 Tax=Xenorhabdus TaxID=626 RepID=UPI0021D5078D|nr:non-ribosomal peptide synthase/polyketide synthase [Xenorhabdus indica]